MIWPLRRKRHPARPDGTSETAPAAPPAPADAPRAPHAPDTPVADGAWARARPLRTTAAPLPAATITTTPLVTAGRGGLARTAPSLLPAADRRPTGTVSGIAVARPRPATHRPFPEPPLGEASALPPPARRRARPTGPAPAPDTLVRAEGAYVGEPRPAAPVEESPPWMRGIVPGMSPDQVAALFGGALGGLTPPSATGAPSAPSAPGQAAPAVTGPGAAAGLGHPPRPRPSLAESRRQAAANSVQRDPGTEPVPGPVSPGGGHREPVPEAPGTTTAEPPATDPGPRPDPQPDQQPDPQPPAAGHRDPVPAERPAGPPAPTARTATRPLGLRPPLEHPSAHRSGERDTAGEGGRPQGPAPPYEAPTAGTVVPRDMASAFALLYGVDVSAVPVHRDRNASARASGMSARAFTERGAVFLPKEAGGMEDRKVRGLLAHELTHAVQQRRHGPSLPAENTSAGLEMERQAVAAEQYFRGDPAAPAPEPAPEPAPAPCDHTPDASAPAQSVSWTPDGGMVTGGVQRASADEITQKFFEEMNELRTELGISKRLSSVSELDRNERAMLELRLRKAGLEEEKESGEEAAKRPLDWAELFAQSASSLASDAMRPFYSRSAEEQKESRDSWRRVATGGPHGSDRSHLDHLDDEEDAESQKSGTGGTGRTGDTGGDGARPRPAPVAGSRPGPAGPADAAAVASLYGKIVELLENDGLLPPGSTTKATTKTTGEAPVAAAAAPPAAGPTAGSAPPGAPGPAPAPGPAAAAPRRGGYGSAVPAPVPVPVKSPAAEPKKEVKEAERPLDYAEVFAQAASSLVGDAMRPFYARNAEETARSRDLWRARALGVSRERATAAERDLLEEEDTAWPVAPVAGTTDPADRTPSVKRASTAPAAVPLSLTPALLADQWDEASLRVLSGRLYPLLVDDLRHDLMAGQQRQGFP
ncbi:DUF4157 domain-containing protein [Streptomyces sp. NPDC004667]|uniref:eCIS core domain-containing protein n=1 Tax=Streptomyces sp. NPDC004667 TaxID=3154285 RepID=UPI0033A2AF95